jgi:hypothetical protein
MTKTYNTDDLFEDIPGDPNNVIFKIPPEICEQQDWKEGDVLKITVEDGRMTISKV